MVKSLINEIAEKKNLQTYIDVTKARFAAIYWPLLLTVKPTNSLKYETLKGSRKSGVAANVTAYNVSAPLHSRDVIGKLSGDIPSMRGKRAMNEDDLIYYIMASSSANADQQQLLNLIFDDTAWASIAPHKRIDWMVARMISTGKITLNTTTNAAGIVTEQEIDFGMDPSHKRGVAVVWSDTANSKPLTDIVERFVKPAAELGITGGVIRMHPTKIYQFLSSNEVLNKFGKLSDGRITGVDLDIETVNAYMQRNSYPVIRPFNASIGIEKDGKVIYSNPWEVNNVSYTPDGQIGSLNVGPIVEKVRPNAQTTYAEYMGNLVKKFGSQDPVQEFTAFEFNAFPSFDAVDESFILQTDVVEV